MNKNLLLCVLSSVLFYLAFSQEVTSGTVEVDATESQTFQEGEENELIHASSVGDLAEVQREIREGANVNFQNAHGWTPLIFAVENDHGQVFQELVDAGANVNIQEDDGWTALMFAGFHGDANMVHHLLDSGADPLLTNHAGFAAHTIAHNQEHFDISSTIANAALTAAMAHDDLESCIHLLREGASINTQNDMGWTVLTLAVSLNAVPEVSILINEFNANVNIAENDGWSPLMFAANNNFISCAEILLAAGANVDYKNAKGLSAVDLARGEKFDEMAELLTTEVANYAKDL